ncbi:MAG: ParA family protein [Deltaproteobacteria bacterium]|jgi:chromosome partitioning protein|nr:ParA family protein [Deltaproteobacteria bacterium]
MGNEQARIIAVANEKGGVGKTVTVVNLGAALCQEGKRVLIVDMDPQFNATRGLGVELKEEMPTVYNLIKGDESIKAQDTIVTTKWHGLDLIPSHVDLSGAEVELVDEIGRENKLKDALDDINNAYDIILLDTPPSLSLLTVNVLAYAKEVLVPCQTHPYAYAALEELFDTILAIKKNINQDLSVVGVLATLFDTRTRVSHSVLEKLKNDDRYGPLLFETVIRVNTTIAESAGVGKPVVFYRQSSFGSLDYTNLAKELLSKHS